MTLQEYYTRGLKKQSNQNSNNIVLHMPEVSQLIKHLDLLYTKLIMSNNQNQNQDYQQVGWYNHGDSRVREA